MSLDSSKPDGATLLSELSSYQRETREAVNNLEATTGAAVNTTLNSDSASLLVGTDLSLNSVEVVHYSGNTTLLTIKDGYEGMIKIFVLESSDIIFQTSEDTNGGEIQLNSYDNLDAQAGDVLALVNVGGDPDAGQHGYWKELYRTLIT